MGFIADLYIKLCLINWELSILNTKPLHSLCVVCGQILTYGLQGKTIDLNPGYTATPDDILWKHNGNKVVEFNGNEQHVYGQFRNRVTLGWISAELQISDLRYEDSGTYEVEIYKNNKLHRYPYVLEVIGKVFFFLSIH